MQGGGGRFKICWDMATKLQLEIRDILTVDLDLFRRLWRNANCITAIILSIAK